MNEYSLHDKELIRRIADFIFCHSSYSSTVLSGSDVYEIFPDMKEIILYIQSNENYDNSIIRDYMENVNDITIKSIFIHAHDSWLRRKE